MAKRKRKAPAAEAAPSPHLAKRRVMFGAVVLLALWPFLHHGVVAYFELDPWLYFGVSMYTQPRPIVRTVDFQYSTADGRLRTLPVHKFENPRRAWFADRAEHVAKRDAAMGRLHPIEDSAQRLFELLPRKIERLAFGFERMHLGPDARLHRRVDRVDCTRDGPVCQVDR
jgi:hypothetical protein